MEHEKNCPVKKAIDIKRAHLVGFGLGIALVSSIGSGTFTFILLKILKVIGG